MQITAVMQSYIYAYETKQHSANKWELLSKWWLMGLPGIHGDLQGLEKERLACMDEKAPWYVTVKGLAEGVVLIS